MIFLQCVQWACHYWVPIWHQYSFPQPYKSPQDILLLLPRCVLRPHYGIALMKWAYAFLCVFWCSDFYTVYWCDYVIISEAGESGVTLSIDAPSPVYSAKLMELPKLTPSQPDLSVGFASRVTENVLPSLSLIFAVSSSYIEAKIFSASHAWATGVLFIDVILSQYLSPALYAAPCLFSENGLLSVSSVSLFSSCISRMRPATQRERFINLSSSSPTLFSLKL